MASEQRVLIAYDDVVNALAKEYGKVMNTHIYSPREILESIRNIRPVDAAPVVHGRWMNIQNGKGICSNCHRLDSVDNLATHCRYCGAKMDGDGNV